MKLKPPAAKPGNSGSKEKSEPKLPDNPKRHPGSMPTSVEAHPIGMSDERKALYGEANEFNATNEETPPPESDQQPPKAEDEETTETPPEEGDTEASTEKEAPEKSESSEDAENPPEGQEDGESEDGRSSEEDEGKKHTMVPHAALHEERQSHKETKAKLQEALELAKESQSQLKVAIEEIQRLKEIPKPDKEEDADRPIDDMETYIKGLKKRLDDAEERERRREERSIDEKERSRAEKMQRAISLVDQELSEQGIPGFSQFHQLVATRIEQKAKGDQKILLQFDNPEGWAEIYKKEVYPEVSKVFKNANKETKKSEKEDLKSKANLSGSNGKPPPKPAESQKKPWGLSDYFDVRSKSRIT
jgi:hypothetical protein